LRNKQTHPPAGIIHTKVLRFETKMRFGSYWEQPDVKISCHHNFTRICDSNIYGVGRQIRGSVCSSRKDHIWTLVVDLRASARVDDLQERKTCDLNYRAELETSTSRMDVRLRHPSNQSSPTPYIVPRAHPEASKIRDVILPISVHFGPMGITWREVAPP
jgi:hypothetical protein